MLSTEVRLRCTRIETTNELFLDLCNANGITGYPTLSVYKDGEFVEKFKGNRVLDTLVPYIKRHAVDVPPPTPEYIPNPNGAVAVLDTKSFQSTLDQGSTFVKFYAPWSATIPFT